MGKLYDVCMANNTDKAYLGYADIYEELFSREWTSVFELGVLLGSSMRAWKEWFPKAKIYGLDNGSHPAFGDTAKYLRSDAMKEYTIFIGDENDEKFMSSTSKELGMVDLIIDDANHDPQVQIKAFNVFKHNVKPGGLYICEDMPLKKDGIKVLRSVNEWWGDYDPAPLTFMQLYPCRCTSLAAWRNDAL